MPDAFDRFRAPSAADDATSERADIAARLEAAGRRINVAVDAITVALNGDVTHHDWPGADEADACHAEAMADRAEAMVRGFGHDPLAALRAIHTLVMAPGLFTMSDAINRLMAISNAATDAIAAQQVRA